MTSDDRIQMIGDAWDESKRESNEVHVLRSNIDVSTMRPSGESINVRRLARNFRLLCWRSIAEQVEYHFASSKMFHLRCVAFLFFY